MTLKQAIETAMKGKRRMTVSEIAEAALPLATSVNGATPKQQVYSLLYGQAQRQDGIVERVGTGTFRLNKNRRKLAASDVARRMGPRVVPRRRPERRRGARRRHLPRPLSRSCSPSSSSSAHATGSSLPARVTASSPPAASSSALNTLDGRTNESTVH